MSCERFREAINGHAAGADITGAAAAHLVSCESCRARLDRHRRVLAEVDEELARMLAVGAPPEFVDRVMSRAAAANSRSIAWRPAAAWVGLAAAAAIAMASLLRAPVPSHQPEAPSGSAAAVPAPAAPPPVPATAEPFVRRQTAARQSPPRSSHRVAAARRTEEPPVIVDPDQARAIARLRELLGAGRMNDKMLPPERQHEAAELAVAPLDIPEIKVPDVEFAGRPPGSAVDQEPKEQ